MADLSTSYMGIKLRSPIVVGACALSKHVDQIKQIEEYGAGALVLKSLFEEQIQLERQELEDRLSAGSEFFAEATTHFANIEHAGPKEHLYWVEQTRKAVKMPLIASLNADSPGSWVDWAKQLEGAGINGLELNLFALGTRAEETGQQVEKRLYDVVDGVLGKVKLPVSVKLSPHFTCLANVAHTLDQRGVKGLVLFNRFFQPDIDVEAAALVQRPHLSKPEEAMLPLRWVGLLSGRVKADLIASTGIHSASTVVKMILAGASAVQVVSALYTHKVGFLKELNGELGTWMDSKGHKSLGAFRGKLSQHKLPDPTAYERAQYIKLLLGFD
jgi:dihydroorotate dehydrogenase (fumarate)